MKSKQRFIAGAICPKCAEMDSLRLDSSDQSIECVDCGYTQTLRERETEQNKKQAAPVITRKVIANKINASKTIRVTNIKS